MTLTDAQRKLTEMAGKAQEKLYHAFHPKTRSATVIITMEIPIVIEDEPAEEETNYSGKISWDFADENKFTAELNDKVIKQIVEEKL